MAQANAANATEAEINAKGDAHSVRALSDIVIQGNIANYKGRVRVVSAEDNILVQGKDARTDVSVNGKDVALIAAKGSVSQGFTDGIVNVGTTTLTDGTLTTDINGTFGGTVNVKAGEVHFPLLDVENNKNGIKIDNYFTEFTCRNCNDNSYGSFISNSYDFEQT